MSTKTQCASNDASPAASEGPRLIFYLTAALALIASVGATVYFCVTMSGGMEMPGGWTMSMMWMRMPGQTWVEAAGMFMLMWVPMMVAMMLPSSLPTFLRYYHERLVANRRAAWGATFVMAVGYFFVWGATGAIIYMPGVFLGFAAMRWSAFSRAIPYLNGATVVIAGCLQFSPWTKFGLSRCRGTFSCDSLQKPAHLRSAWRRGMDFGVCCVACCLGPTLILLALGMMNPAVIVSVAAVIALEKLLPKPHRIVRWTGIAAIIGGLAIIGRCALGS
jgi:predicted metal-binding membrane protein